MMDTRAYMCKICGPFNSDTVCFVIFIMGMYFKWEIVAYKTTMLI